MLYQVRSVIYFAGILLVWGPFTWADITEPYIPKYCAFYPKFIDSERSSAAEKSLDIRVCSRGRETIYEVAELASKLSTVEEQLLDQMGEDLQKRLTHQAIKEVLNKKREYVGLIGGEAFNTSALNYCMKKMRKTKEGYGDLFAVEGHNKNIDFSVDEEKIKDFVILSIVNTLKAHSLFEINKEHFKEKEKARKQAVYTYNKCLKQEELCRKKTSFWRDTKHCTLEVDNCQRIKNEKKEKKYSLLDEKISPLYKMISSSPLLFNNKSEGGFFSLTEAKDLGPSAFMEKINKLIALNIKTKLIKLTSKNEKKAIDQFYEKNIALFDDILNSPERYREIKKAMNDEVRKELSKLDDSMEDLCNGKGENLHHYPELVNNTLQGIFDSSLSSEDLKHQVAASQASYCHLLNTLPLEKETTNAAMTGFVLLGFGLAMQAVPFVGQAVGVPVLATSSTMIATSGAVIAIGGGGVLSGIAAHDLYQEHQKLGEEIALHASGLHGYEKLMKTKKNRDSLRNWVIADGFVLGADLKLLHYLKNLRKEKLIEKQPQKKRFDTEHRKTLDQIELELGESKAPLLRKYNKGNHYNLSSRDKIYIASLSKMLEGDFKRSNKSISNNTLSRKVKEVLDRVVNKCKKQESK